MPYVFDSLIVGHERNVCVQSVLRAHAPMQPSLLIRGVGGEDGYRFVGDGSRLAVLLFRPGYAHARDCKVLLALSTT